MLAIAQGRMAAKFRRCAKPEQYGPNRSVIYQTYSKYRALAESMELGFRFESLLQRHPIEKPDIERPGNISGDFHKLLHFLLDHGAWRAI
jgi:hypothetical protein